MNRSITNYGLSGLVVALLVGTSGLHAESVDNRIAAAEARRIAVIQKVTPSVVAVMTGGGSGVLIDEDGYALTNFHVTSAAGGPLMKCGLPDGVLYDAVLVGLDKVGDVALIKLLPKKPGDKFPFAKLGDSDKVQAGDWSLAMGNPFLLATDFTPTVTFGLVSGVHRYQYPAGSLLEYTDCIQIDTSINPGNSGGPLFNMDGELIGINGRGSFEKRGRVNSGVGYAISINQIKNFLGQLRAGMDTDHASLGAFLSSETDEGALSKLVVTSLLPDCDVQRRGLEVRDELLAFAGRPMYSVNQYKNVIGLYPRGWRMPLTYRHNNAEKREIPVRLMGAQRREVPGRNPDQQQPPQPGGPRPPPLTGPGAKLYEAKPGFANYYFNKLEREKLLKEIKAFQGDFSNVQGTWSIKVSGLVNGNRSASDYITIRDKGSRDGKSELIEADIAGIQYSLEPLKVDQERPVFLDPPGSGGLLIAMHNYRQLLAHGEKRFEGEFSHGGIEPFYLLPAGDREKPDYAKLRVDCAVLRTKHSSAVGKWYFALKDDAERKITKGQLLGAEVTVDREPDPCELYFSDYHKVDGRQLPGQIQVVFGEKTFAIFNDVRFKMDGVK